MAWNEPGGGKDPWGGNRNDQGPPDIDEALKKLKEKLSAFGGGRNGASSDGGGPSTNIKMLVPITVVALAILWGLLGFFQVDATERAVMLRLGKYSETYDEGLRWYPPLIAQKIIVNVTGERQYTTRGLMLTEDENIVEVALTVQYNISSAKDFVLSIKSPETSLQQATDSALRHVVGSTGLDGVISTERGLVSDAIKIKLQQLLDRYFSGINVVNINIADAKPPNDVKAAYDDVVKAVEDEERLVNEAQAYSNGIIPEARGEAQRLREEAEAYRSQVISKSQGEANRFSALLAEYAKAPEVTRERLYIDAIEQVMSDSTKVLIDNESGNNMLYLPLDKLIQQGVGSSSARANETNNQLIDRVANEVIEKLQRNSKQLQGGRGR